MASSSSPPEHYNFSTVFSSCSHKLGENPPAFSGIEPQIQRTKVSESTRLYDVFINHRGPDVKETLALELYKSLEKLKIQAFLDSKEKVLGDSFPSTIQTAIHSAAVHIAIFSKGYAESAWCLAELVLMLRSRAKTIPVFYRVKPSGLRYIEKGVYGKAFAEYENKERYMEKLEEWKQALQSISFIAGEEFNSFSDCEKIVSAVQKEVERMRRLHVAKYPVGLPKLVQDFEKQCNEKLLKDFESQCGMNKQEGMPKIVGIFGMGGVGKTTLSKELFNRKHSDYSRSCFLFDVGEAHVKKDLPSLQMKLLRELFDENDHPSFPSVDDGISCLSNRFARSRNRSFLIVVDDIDHHEQLEALVVSDELNNSGNSLVIVTTRDVGVLINAGITVGYNLKGMDADDAKELFCWHAFSRCYPFSGYEKLVDHFVDLCGGLPLSLQVLGRHVHGEDKKFWELELGKVKKTLPQDIHKKLKISIDTLDNEEKQIIMDVACFFIEELKKDAIRVWEGSGWSAQHALRRLKNKCLVEEINVYKFMSNILYSLEDTRGELFVLRMHDHLRDLGREMADQLNHPRRLWRTVPLISKGIKSIFTQTKGRCLHTCIDRSGHLYVKYFLGDSNNMAETSAALLWLKVIFYDHIATNIPPWIRLQNLQTLSIIGGGLKSLWQNNVQLKELRIYNQTELKELNLGFLRCLEEITIHRCENLKHVFGISDLRKLVELKIAICSELEEINFVRPMCLEKIRISNCRRLITLGGMSNLRKLVELSIDLCKLEEINLAQLSCVERIKIFSCEHLKSVIGISDLAKLEILHISYCKKIEELSLVRLGCLEFCIISNLLRLKRIELKGCKNLISVDGIFWKLVKLNIYDCPKLEKIPGIVKLHSLERMQLLYCSNETIRNCFLNMEKLPSEFIKVIGIAVDGAESTVNENLFCDFINANSVVEIGIDNTCSHLGRYMVSAIIFCAVIVVKTSTAANMINEVICEYDINPWLKFEVRQGEWMITSVITKEDEINSYIVNKGYCFPFDYLCFPEDVMVKRVTMPVMKGEEQKILNVLRTIVDKLYQN
ncbi:disease resistance protein Roq1-like isoform X3 [Cryptomeria japonica]|uniref:disease resistance protein Roq1-like isoform X3 n=1 Tax=Cryptomeria japonica TaxID=3369 RepID=UPI0027DA5721|nr:disease resistance protein Roq1-like isoform X3 [Cryptomeria japonica]